MSNRGDILLRLQQRIARPTPRASGRAGALTSRRGDLQATDARLRRGERRSNHVAGGGLLHRLEKQIRPDRNDELIVEATAYDTGLPVQIRTSYGIRSFASSRSEAISNASAMFSRGDADDVRDFLVESFEEPKEAASPCSCCGEARLADRHAETSTGPVSIEDSPEESPGSSAPATVKHARRSVERPPATSPAPRGGLDETVVDSDLKALLGRDLPEPAPMPSAPASSPATDDAGAGHATAASVEDPHSVFDRMGRSLQYANTFNLGSIDLSERFSEFERELDREERATPVSFSAIQRPSELDDTEIAVDLAHIHECVGGAATPSSPQPPELSASEPRPDDVIETEAVELQPEARESPQAQIEVASEDSAPVSPEANQRQTATPIDSSGEKP